MLKNKILAQIRLHPIATALFVMYVALWAGLVYLTFTYLVQRDADGLMRALYYAFSIFIPYLLINYILAKRSVKYKRFYTELSLLIFIPIGIVILIYLFHELERYLNMGM